MVSVVAVVQVGVSVVAEVSMVSMVGKSVAMVETVSVVGIAMVVEGIGIGFGGSDSSRLSISRPLAVVVSEVSKVGVSIVAVEPMAIGEAMAVVVAKMVSIAVVMGVVSISRCISISI